MPEKKFKVAPMAKKYKGKKPRYRSSVARPVSRRRADDEYHDSRRPGRTPFRRFEEGKLTKSRLKQIIRETLKEIK